ncbi:phosphatase PAP2 family protein [bacterium]|nr:phosphatase PAP2 family protein [bacterium]
MDWLYSIDVSLFRFGNETIANPAGDWFFPFITDLRNFIVPYILVLLALIVFGKKRGAITVLLILITVAFADQISSFVVKPLVGRLRPCHVLDHVRLLVGCGSGKSFTSSHATNNFAIAVIVQYMWPKARWYILTWAALVAFSRVYVGVHYPSDIIGGAVLGSLIAFAVIFLYEQTLKGIQFVKARRSAGAVSTGARGDGKEQA